MKTRPTSLLGLTLAVIRLRPALVAGCACAAMAVASLGAWRATRPTGDGATLDAATWFAGDDARTRYGDPTVIATPSGWLLAYALHPRTLQSSVQVVALDRAGAVRGEPVAVSERGQYARMPRLTRGPRGNALVWASTPEGRFEPGVRFMLLDDDAKTLQAPRALGEGERSVDPHATWTGDGWGVGWSRIEAHGGYTLVRLTPDGVLIGDPTRLDAAHNGMQAALVWNGSSWMVAQSVLRRRDTRTVRLTWIDRGGRTIATRDLARWRCDNSEVTATTRGASAWVVWGERCGRETRAPVRIARVDDRVVAQPPRTLEPTREGAPPSIACAGDACTLARISIDDHGRRSSSLYLQRLDVDGAPLGPPRRLGAPGDAQWMSTAAVAHSTDHDTLVVWSTSSGGHGALRVARLDARGAPLEPPRVLPLSDAR